MNSDEKFIDVLQKNGLRQHITTPTRQRGDDEPHVLDLVITSIFKPRLGSDIIS